MKTRKQICPVCGKKFKTKEWRARKGFLKGSTIVKKIFCSNKCRKRLRLLVDLNEILDELEK